MTARSARAEPSAARSAEFDTDSDGRQPGKKVLQGLAERVMERCECLIDIAAALFSVSGRELRQPGRSSLPVARVRQIAMYIGHVALGMSMAEIGRGFGRDRTTVQHACHLIEDMRDDAEFDRIVAVAERVALAALRNRAER